MEDATFLFYLGVEIEVLTMTRGKFSTLSAWFGQLLSTHHLAAGRPDGADGADGATATGSQTWCPKTLWCIIVYHSSPNSHG